MRIYFSGIGGVGIGPLAQIAIDAGYDVIGSDTGESLMTKELTTRGVEISYDQSGAFMRAEHAKQPIDWFVHTAALTPEHPELMLAAELQVRIAKRDELLAHIIQEKNLKLLAVAGTHGKTNTTGMLVWALKQQGIPASYSVGTTLQWGPSGTYVPGSEYFVYECDEFDRNMLHFSPHASIITSLDYDHPDTYTSQAAYAEAFRQFVRQSKQTIMWQTDADYIELRAENSWALQANEVAAVALAGEHTRRNATLVLKLLEYLNVGNTDANRAILDTFPGTSRRFEQLAPNLYSDYGHHPEEIAATLQMARELCKHVVLVYQPHQNVRQYEVRDQYTNDVFSNCEEVYWLPTYLSREDAKQAVLEPKELTKKITTPPITYSTLGDELWSHIKIELHKGHLVVCMGAGSIDSWLREQLT